MIFLNNKKQVQVQEWSDQEEKSEKSEKSRKSKKSDV